MGAQHDLDRIPTGLVIVSDKYSSQWTFVSGHGSSLVHLLNAPKLPSPGEVQRDERAGGVRTYKYPHDGKKMGNSQEGGFHLL
jgi:hypothetical protein